MNNWMNATESDRDLMYAASLIFDKRPELYKFFFHPDKPQLRYPCAKIKQLAKSMCSSDELLVRIALDVWCGNGGISFNEIYQKLDEETCGLIVLTIRYLCGERTLEGYRPLKRDTPYQSAGQLKEDIF